MQDINANKSMPGSSTLHRLARRPSRLHRQESVERLSLHLQSMELLDAEWQQYQVLINKKGI